MNSKIEDLERLKKQAERMRQERDRAAGRLEESEKRLKDEFQVDSLEAAEKLLKQLQKEEAAAQDKFDTAMTAFEQEWKGKLEQ